MSKLKLVIIDDDLPLCKLLEIFINTNCNDFIELVGMCHDGKSGLEMVKNLKPDAMIIDNVLPWYDGISVLSRVKPIPGLENIICVMFSALANDLTLHEAMCLGCDYFFTKPFNFDLMIQKIRQLYEFRANERKTDFAINSCSDSVVSKTEPESDNLSKLLWNAGIQHINNGFYHLKFAIDLCIEDKRLLDSVTKQLYPGVAKAFNTSGSRVEHSIRYLLKTSWEHGAGILFTKVTGLPDIYIEKKPTNSIFIRQAVELYEKTQIPPKNC